MIPFVDRYRPQNPEQLIGDYQQRVGKALQSTVQSYNKDGGKLRPILLIGPSGSGKTTIGQMYTRWLIGEKAEVNVVNCSADGGIDRVRQIISGLALTSLFNNGKSVYFLEEVHGLSKAAQNSFLDDLENLPKHVTLIAATTDPQKLLDTFKSRFDTHRLNTPSEFEQGRLLKSIARIEDIDLTQEQVDEIVANSGGNVRTLVHNLQAVKEGKFEFFEEESQESDLVSYLFREHGKDLMVAFRKAQGLEYTGESIRLSSYAISVLSRTGKSIVAQKVLEEFGDGLSGTGSPKTIFYRKLMRVLS